MPAVLARRGAVDIEEQREAGRTGVAAVSQIEDQDCRKGHLQGRQHMQWAA